MLGVTMNVEERFNEVYQKILEENTSEMEEARKEAQKEKTHNNKFLAKIIIIDIIIIFLVLIFAPVLFEFVLSILFVVSSIIHINRLLKNKDSKIDKFRSDFKTKVVNALIKSFNQQLEYEPYSVICSYMYDEAEFEKYDLFDSEDLITGKLENNCEFEMSEILTQNVSRDSEGHTHYSTICSGLFAKIETPKPFNTMLYIRNDKR